MLRGFAHVMPYDLTIRKVRKITLYFVLLNSGGHDCLLVSVGLPYLFPSPTSLPNPPWCRWPESCTPSPREMATSSSNSMGRGRRCFLTITDHPVQCQPACRVWDKTENGLIVPFISGFWGWPSKASCATMANGRSAHRVGFSITPQLRDKSVK